MSRDEFNARRAAMDKKLADSYRQLDDLNLPNKIDDLCHYMDKRFDDVTTRLADSHATLTARLADSHATLAARIEDSHATLAARMEDSQPTQAMLIARMEQIMSSFDNFKRHITTQGRVHQDLHAPTMGVTMHASGNLTLKSMVQTIHNILIAYVRGRNLSHARMRATYPLRTRAIHHMS
jgi:hypothetical protein